MSTLTLFEHETVPQELSAHQLTLLAQLQQRLGEKVLQPVYRTGSWYLRAGQYVGVVRLGPWTIQILPKIYKASDLSEEARARTATANLLHMLAYAGILRVRESEVSDLLSRESDWFEILTYLFARHLHEEWQRGPTRSYQVQEDELPLLKGKWRLNEQFRRPERAHRFAVAYDEFTADIPLNRIFRFVVERLSRLTRSSLNARLLGILRETLDDVTLVPVATVEEADRIAFNRLNARYEPLRNLARLFLDGGALQTASGDTSLFAFVFDMNAVFEGFIAGFLQRHRATALPAELQQHTMRPQSRGRSLSLAQSEGEPYFRLKPDLLFHQGGANDLIVDTKYKRLDPSDRKLGISEADFYQMYAYAGRYQCPRVLMLYPQSAEVPATIRRQFDAQGAVNATISAATIDIRRDLGRSFERAALATELCTILSQR